MSGPKFIKETGGISTGGGEGIKALGYIPTVIEPGPGDIDGGTCI